MGEYSENLKYEIDILQKRLVEFENLLKNFRVDGLSSIKEGMILFVNWPVGLHLGISTIYLLFGSQNMFVSLCNGSVLASCFSVPVTGALFALSYVSKLYHKECEVKRYYYETVVNYLKEEIKYQKLETRENSDIECRSIARCKMIDAFMALKKCYLLNSEIEFLDDFVKDLHVTEEEMSVKKLYKK